MEGKMEIGHICSSEKGQLGATGREEMCVGCVYGGRCVGCLYACMCVCASVSMWFCPQEEDT